VKHLSSVWRVAPNPPFPWERKDHHSSGVLNFLLSGGSALMATDANGKVGIGTTTPQSALDVSGTIRHSGIVLDLSDRRLKSNIRQLPSSLEAMLRLNPVSFSMNDNLSFCLIAIGQASPKPRSYSSTTGP
jgi:hypothetical protein